MTSPKTWESSTSLRNSAQSLRNRNMHSSLSYGRPGPVLPPRPLPQKMNSYNMSHSVPSYNFPYGSSLYGAFRPSYGDYNNFSIDYPGYSRDMYERRLIHSAEGSARLTFASIESVVRAFNSMAMLLDNTFFTMTSSFRAILDVAENFGRLRTLFGDIWHSVNIYRMLTWFYKKLRHMMGFKVSRNPTSVAWKEATNGLASSNSSWPTLAFLGVIVSAPYIISMFLPKYEGYQQISKRSMHDRRLRINPIYHWSMEH